MRIAYCTLLLPEEKRITEKVKGHLSGVSLHKFSKALISGLDANLERPVDVFNIINVLNFPAYKELVFRTESWHHKQESNDIHIGYLNLFGIKYITQAMGLFRRLDKWVKQDPDKCVIIIHSNYYPLMIAAKRIKKKYHDKVVNCLITGDVPGQYGEESKNKKTLKERLITVLDKKLYKMSKDYDCYVFQTPFMGERFGVEDKPIYVIECTYIQPKVEEHDNKLLKYSNKGKKVVFYAGSLREEYGILHLIRAFELIDGSEYELWLAGGGNAEEKIKEIQKKDNRIKLLGFISPGEVAARQEAATVLVSPRMADLDFVKYSFPSKTMECLASGKPYIAHKLPCEPQEYAKYILYPDDESDEALSKKIMEICSLPERDREDIGRKGRSFILNEKNPKTMCRGLVEFLYAQIV